MSKNADAMPEELHLWPKPTEMTTKAEGRRQTLADLKSSKRLSRNQIKKKVKQLYHKWVQSDLKNGIDRISEWSDDEVMQWFLSELSESQQKNVLKGAQTWSPTGRARVRRALRIHLLRAEMYDSVVCEDPRSYQGVGAPVPTPDRSDAGDS